MTTSESPTLSCAVVPDRQVVRLVLTGELDLASAPVVDGELVQLREVGFGRIAVDLHELTFMDTQGAHLLARWPQRASEEGFELSLGYDERGPVGRLLSLTGALG